MNLAPFDEIVQDDCLPLFLLPSEESTMLRRQPSILLGLLLILPLVACTPEMTKDESAQPDDNPVIEGTAFVVDSIMQDFGLVSGQ